MLKEQNSTNYKRKNSALIFRSIPCFVCIVKEKLIFLFFRGNIALCIDKRKTCVHLDIAYFYAYHNLMHGKTHVKSKEKLSFYSEVNFVNLLNYKKLPFMVKNSYSLALLQPVFSVILVQYFVQTNVMHLLPYFT